MTTNDTLISYTAHYLTLIDEARKSKLTTYFLAEL